VEGACRYCVGHSGVQNLEYQDSRDSRRHRFDVPFDTVLLEQVRRFDRQIMHIRMTGRRLSRAGPAGIRRTYNPREERLSLPAVFVLR
jgi:hypothetical protein